jgi:hypothetical protein
MNGAIGGINQGVWLPQSQVVNLDDLLKTIPKTQQYKSFEHQIPIFDDINEYVTPNQTSKEAFNVVSPRTRAFKLFSTRSKLSRSWKQPSLHDFFNQNNNKGRPNLKTKLWNKKIRIRTQQMQDKNSIRFHYKDKTRTKKNCDKKTYPKLMLSKLKVMRISISIYTYWAFKSRMFLKELSTYMWRMCTHRWPMCTYV